MEETIKQTAPQACTPKGDCFDRLLHWKPLRFAEPFYRRHKAVLLYLFFGALTTLVSILSFALFHSLLGITETLANIPSWILAVLFAYVTNRIWVFQSCSQQILGEITAFFCSRLGTLALEELILWVFASTLGLPAMLVKIAAQLLVILLNYLLSKLLVFRNQSH